jgi:hypothetical protein
MVRLYSERQQMVEFTASPADWFWAPGCQIQAIQFARDSQRVTKKRP